MGLVSAFVSAVRWRGLAVLIAALAVVPVASAAEPACTAPPDALKLAFRLPHFAQKIAEKRPVKIVAVGSSSTAGLGATDPSRAYPAVLQGELRRRFPGQEIVVLNRGQNGNETRDVMGRFDRDVIAEKPDLVLWQTGTNTLLNGHDMWNVFLDLRAGIRRLAENGADVVLLNPQYSPRVLARTNYRDMLDLVEVAGRETRVSVFNRFAIMQAWSEQLRYGFDVYTTPDGLHMNDWGYGCTAMLLGKALADRITDQSASVAPR